MEADNNIQELGLFSIPIGDKKWFAEHTRRHHHHHHHHSDNETRVSKQEESTPAEKK